MALYNDYIHTKKLGLNTEAMIWSSNEIRNWLVGNKDYYQAKNQPFYADPNAPETTNMFGSYNVFTFPLPEVHNLYRGICNTFREISGSTGEHMIQCWVNHTPKGSYLDWHKHHEPEESAWHGFYCVNVGDSKTTYRIPKNGLHDVDENNPETYDEIDVAEGNDTLIISLSGNDRHRTYPWDGENERITIAFDIVPIEHVPAAWLDHWIPVW